MYQDYLVACDAVIYGETGATNAAVWWHRFLSFLSDAIFVAASGYGTSPSSAFRQHVESAWLGVSRVCCIERFCTLLCVGFVRVVCVSISVDYSGVCKGILETFEVLLFSVRGTPGTNIDRGNLCYRNVE